MKQQLNSHFFIMSYRYVLMTPQETNERMGGAWGGIHRETEQSERAREKEGDCGVEDCFSLLALKWVIAHTAG